MNKLINFFKRWLPAYIEVRSLYWVERGREMDLDLRVIFDLIDNDRYGAAFSKIGKFKRKWDGIPLPLWLCEKRSEVCRAEAMVNFLTAPLD